MIDYEKILKAIVTGIIEADGNCYTPDYEWLQQVKNDPNMDLLEYEILAADLTQEECDMVNKLVNKAYDVYTARCDEAQAAYRAKQKG